MQLMSGDQVDIQIAINGQPMAGLLRASVSTTNCFSADTYSLKIAISKAGGSSLAFWDHLASAYVEVTAVLSTPFGATYRTLITGMADTIHIDPIRGVVGVEGRDLSAAMIDSYSQKDFVNQTASEIVSAIAAFHNLQAVVVPTSEIIGRYYGDGYTRLSLGQFSRVQSDWDFVVQLARQNHFDVYVVGRSLYFQPSRSSVGTPVLISAQDVEGSRIERNLCFHGAVGVKVQSWNSQNMTAYDGNSQATPLDPAANGAGLPFLFTGSNFTAQQVTNSAGQYASELSRLGTTLHLDMPWDPSLSPRMTIFFDAADALYGMTYRIESIDRYYSSTRGSSQILRALRI